MPMESPEKKLTMTIKEILQESEEEVRKIAQRLQTSEEPGMDMENRHSALCRDTGYWSCGRLSA